jgi:hypothetical protein
MTDRNANQPFKGHYNRELFSPEFFPLDYHEEDNHLTGITVGVHKNAATFTLTMATVDIYTNRKIDDDDEVQDDVFVVANNEILPSDLIDIKIRLLTSDELDQYLIKQTY